MAADRGPLARRVVVAAACCALAAGCAPRAAIVLPSASGAVPSPDAAAWADEARRACRAGGALTAEIGVAGRVHGQKVRGRLLVGFADGGRARLEALAPFGQPVFILVADGGQGTLLLPRDRRVVSDAPPRDLLDATTGLALDVGDLRALLTGCVVAGAAGAGSSLGRGWMAVPLDGGRATAYLQRTGETPARLVAAEVRGNEGPLRVSYSAWNPAGIPLDVRLERAGAASLSLNVRVSQLDAHAELDGSAFTVTVPAGTAPMPLADLRRASLIGEPR